MHGNSFKAQYRGTYLGYFATAVEAAVAYAKHAGSAETEEEEDDDDEEEEEREEGETKNERGEETVRRVSSLSKPCSSHDITCARDVLFSR